MDADVIVVGAGLAGLVAARELTRRGRRVLLIDQENAKSIGGQAFWSFGGLFLVDTPEQRRLRVHDSFDLAWADWLGSAQFSETGANDVWARRWARAYVEFAAGEKRSWLGELGIGLTPLVGWAERGGLTAGGHGNSVPRFHVPWGTGTGVVEPFVRAAEQAVQDGRLTIRHRHRLTELVTTAGSVTGVRGVVLAPDDAPRGVATSREVLREFEFSAPAVIVTTGGIGADHDLVRTNWPSDLGTPPRQMVTGVPAYVDGSGLRAGVAAGGHWVNAERMWHYTEGLHNWSPIWPGHGIRILPGPSSMWFDALGRRLPPPCLPGYDTRATLRHLRTAPGLAEHDHSWLVLNQRIIAKEFALSGSEQNPDLTARDRRAVARERLSRGVPAPVAAFQRHGEDFLTAPDVDELVRRMNALIGTDLIEAQAFARQVRDRDAQVANPFSKDVQVQGIHNSRRFLGDRLSRTVAAHPIADPGAGPLVAVRIQVLTRKTLGGLQTDLDSRVLDDSGAPVQGLFAAGEVAGFGGGGVHGHNALEGTFLGGCLFSGRAAGRAAAG